MSRALELAERACQAAEGDEADASAHVESSGFARFAASAVHQPTLIRDETVTLRVVRDGRVGCATTNRTDDEGLAAAARRAAEAADRSPVDPGFAGLQEPPPVPEVGGYDEATAALTPEDQAEAAAAAIAAAPDSASTATTRAASPSSPSPRRPAIAVSQAMTDASVLALAATDDASGYAEATSWRAADLDPAAVAREAAEKAARTRGAGKIEPADLPRGARAVRDLRAPLLLRLHVLERPRAPRGPQLPLRPARRAALRRRASRSGTTGSTRAGYPKAFDFEGVPKQRVLLVEDGVARDVVWDRRTAKQAGDGRRLDRARAGAPGAGLRADSLQPLAGRRDAARWTSSPSASATAST